MIIDTILNQSTQIIFYLVIIAGLWLSLWVYSAGKDKIANKFFSLMVLVWLIGVIVPYYVFRTVSLSEEIIVFLPKIELVFVFLFYIPFYFFTIYFLREEKKFPVLNKILPIMASIGAFLSLTTDFFQKEVLIVGDKGLDLILTPTGKVVWLGFVIAMNLFILSRFLINYLKFPKKEKTKIQYLLLGMSIWILLGFTFLVFFPLFKNTFEHAFWGLYGIIFLFIFTAYAIVKRDLFEIKVVLTGILVSAISILLIVDVFFFTETAPAQILKTVALVVFLAFGYYLIKSVNREIKQREELQKLATELEKANIELKKLDISKTEFISIASHQLRTPLTAIKGYLSMVNDGTYGKLPDIAKEKLKNVFESNERLIRLVNDLLNVSRIETGKMGLEKNEIKVEDFIQQITKDLAINAKKKKLYLKFTKPKEKLPKISVDESKLRQVFLNITDNAIKYTNKGGITISAEKTKDNFILIEITDTGEGMGEQDLSKIFERFSRGNAGNWMHAEGAGLGLYIAKQFTEMHNGKIWAESEGEGKGSKFYIKLPIG